ncbi:hypothetical protein GP5015_2265 [gamma proteobacterium HTCC5015]|nr:hypothetical protein GP5015_2265 [gamma proteobacterium HTCC5015]
MTAKLNSSNFNDFPYQVSQFVPICFDFAPFIMVLCRFLTGFQRHPSH